MLLCRRCTVRAFVRADNILKKKRLRMESHMRQREDLTLAKTMAWKELAQKPTGVEKLCGTNLIRKRRDGERRQRPPKSPREERGKRKVGEGGGRRPLLSPGINVLNDIHSGFLSIQLGQEREVQLLPNVVILSAAGSRGGGRADNKGGETVFVYVRAQRGTIMAGNVLVGVPAG